MNSILDKLSALERYKKRLQKDVIQLLNKEDVVSEKTELVESGIDYFHYYILYTVKNKIDNVEIYNIHSNYYFDFPFDGSFYSGSKLVLLPKTLRNIIFPVTIQKSISLNKQNHTQPSKEAVTKGDPSDLLQKIHKYARTEAQEREDSNIYNKIINDLSDSTVHITQKTPSCYSVQKETNPNVKPGLCETLFIIQEYSIGPAYFYEFLYKGTNISEPVSPYMAAKIWHAVTEQYQKSH